MNGIVTAGIVGVMPAPSATRTIDAADLSGRFTGRLVVVEPLRPEDIDGLIEAAADPDIFTWFSGVNLSDPATLRGWADTALTDARRSLEVPFVIRSAAGGEVLGSTRFLSLQLAHLVAEIGWTWVTRAAWGTGVNVETKLLLLTHAFETVGLRRVEFKTDARNERSRAALAALGAQSEGTLRKHRVLPDGSPRDSAYYAVIDDEWAAVKAHLTQRLETHT